jgi:hypothetical protein
VQQVSYGPLIMNIMLIMSCYTGFFNVRRGWQSLNTGPRFYLRLIRRTGWLWIYTSRTTDGRPFKPKRLSVPFLYPGVDPFQRTSASRAEKPGAYYTPGTPSGRGVPWLRFELTTSVVIGTDYIGSCKFTYHTITITTPSQKHIKK